MLENHSKVLRRGLALAALCFAILYRNKKIIPVSMETAIEEEASGYHWEAFAMVPTGEDYNVELKCRILFIH